MNYTKNFKEHQLGSHLCLQPALLESIYINPCSLNETSASIACSVSETTVLDHLPQHLQDKDINRNLCISSVQCDQWHKRSLDNEQKQQNQSLWKTVLPTVDNVSPLTGINLQGIHGRT